MEKVWCSGWKWVGSWVVRVDEEWVRQGRAGIMCDAECRNAKIGLIIVVWIIGLVAGFIPWILPRLPRLICTIASATDEEKVKGWILRTMDALSGGVLLAVAVFDLMPEAVDLLRDHEIQMWNGVPVSFAVFLVAFLLTIGFERVITVLLVRMVRHNHVSNLSVGALTPHKHMDEKEDETREVHISETPQYDVEEGISELRPTGSNFIGKSSASSDSNVSSMPHHTALCDHGHFDPSDSPPLVGLVATFIGLSFHSVFEGLALGLGSWEQSIFIFIAICAHKAFDGFAVGNQAFKTHLNSWTKGLVVLIYSLVSPVPAFIGLIFNGRVDDIAQGIFMAMGAGTLVSFSTVGQLGGIIRSKWRISGFLTYLAGVFIIVMIFTILDLTGIHEKAESHRLG